MDLTGKIIAILQPKGGISKSSGNEWKAQEYVIETSEQYPKKMCFEVFGAEKIQQFNIQQGEELTVSFDIDARQWQDRWFNSIRAWKVERITTANASSTTPPLNTSASATATTVPELIQENANDDLPF